MTAGQHLEAMPQTQHKHTHRQAHIRYILQTPSTAWPCLALPRLALPQVDGAQEHTQHDTVDNTGGIVGWVPPTTTSTSMQRRMTTSAQKTRQDISAPCQDLTLSRLNRAVTAPMPQERIPYKFMLQSALLQAFSPVRGEPSVRQHGELLPAGGGVWPVKVQGLALGWGL